MPKYATITIYSGPDDSWEILEEITKVSRSALVDMNQHLAEVEQLEPGIPIDIPYQAKKRYLEATTHRDFRARTPYDVAKAELLLDVAQIPGAQNNPRIVLYHATTVGGAAPDETAWCSSFMNYCVEKSGRVGTDSKAARSWKAWGTGVSSANWREGDIVVFWQGSPSGWRGHVAFLVRWDGARPLILGGNQGGRLCIADPLPYAQILSVRRPR